MLQRQALLILKKADAIIEKIEITALVAFLAIMMLVAFSQVILRNFFSTALSWGDGLTRALVLWVGFMGASVAVKQGRYINIDAFSRLLPEKSKRISRLVIYIFSTVVCILLGIAAVSFVLSEYEAGTTYSIGIASWIVELVIPSTFFFLSVRFSLKALLLISGEPLERQEWEQ